MGVINCKLRIATGDIKNTDYIATVAKDTVEACPNRGRDIVLILGDTAVLLFEGLRMFYSSIRKGKDTDRAS